MAGVVLNNEIIITNSKSKKGEIWPIISGKQLSKKFKICQFKFYNDFEIASYAIINMKESDLIKLNSHKGVPYHIKSVCGIGTGLGISMVVPVMIDGRPIYQVWPGEGGHCCFSCITNELQSYYNFLK